MEILKINICSAKNVGKVWISRKKILLTPFGAIPCHFLHGPKKIINIIMRSLHLTPTPKVQAWPGTWKSRCFGQNENFCFLTHSRDLGAILPPNWSYRRCAYFLFLKIIKILPVGPKKRPMTPKNFCLGVQKKRPMTLEKIGLGVPKSSPWLLKKIGLGVPKSSPWLLKKIGLGVPKSSPWLKIMPGPGLDFGGVGEM